MTTTPDHEITALPWVRVETGRRIERFPETPMKLDLLTLAYAGKLKNRRVDEMSVPFARRFVVSDDGKAP